MEKSVHIDKRALIERINEIDDVKVLEKLSKILFAGQAKVVMPRCPSAISVQELRDIIERNDVAPDGVSQDVFIKQAMQWR